jgi:single-strand DNA-binding protein
MTIVGRITRDAVVNSTKDERKVVNFTLAINERYKPKEGEPVKVTTYCNCSYWITEKVAKNLKKGNLGRSNRPHLCYRLCGCRWNG